MSPTATIPSDSWLLVKISPQMYTTKMSLTTLTQLEFFILCVRGSFPELKYINTQFYNFLPIFLSMGFHNHSYIFKSMTKYAQMRRKLSHYLTSI